VAGRTLISSDICIVAAPPSLRCRRSTVPDLTPPRNHRPPSATRRRSNRSKPLGGLEHRAEGRVEVGRRLHGIGPPELRSVGIRAPDILRVEMADSRIPFRSRKTMNKWVHIGEPNLA
jgi:hypothetical protein